MSVPSPRDTKNGYLSTPPLNTTENFSARRRSVSVAGSARSSRSGITEVEDDSDIAIFGIPKKIQRRSTKVTSIKLSWWDCVVGLFSLNKIRRKIADTVEIEDDMSEDEHETTTKPSPWILPVYVCSLEKDASNHWLQEEAMCTIDTGNLQGNLVSKDFALRLGYTEDKFEPLKDREKNGGTSASGHPIIPEGVIHLTWYHSNSTRTFRKMRFLVSQSQQCDLVIGARSIQKHKLLCAPNLAHTGGTTLSRPLDNNFVALDRVRARLENDLTTSKLKLQNVKKGNKPNKAFMIENLETEISQMEKERDVAKLKVELYSENLTLTNDPTNRRQKAIVATIENDLKEAEAKLPKEEEPKPIKSPPPPPGPHITVTRTPTGLSIISGIIRRSTRPNN